MTASDLGAAPAATSTRARFAAVPSALALTGIVLAGAALRLYHLDAQSIWYDEAFTIAQSGKPLDGLLAALVAEGGRHPPLHYWLLHAWFGLTGYGAYQARLWSAVAGTLSIPALYLLARRFAGPATALSAAGLLAVSQMAVYFSQEARSYMTAQCLALVTAGAFMWLLARPTLARTAVFAAATLALLSTHYYGIATLLALGLYWLVVRRECSPLVGRRLVLAGVLVAVGYAPWPLALRSSAEAQPGRVFQERDVSERPNLLAPVMALNRFNNGKLTSIEAPSSAGTVALGLGLFTVPVLVGFWMARRQRSAVGPGTAPDAAVARARHGLLLGVLLAALPVGLAMALGLVGATFNYRHYSFAVPGYYLAVAVAWQLCFPRPVVRAGWFAAALALSAVALRASYTVPTKPDYRAALAPMAAAFRAGDCAVTRPTIWHDEMHLAWDVYYRDRGAPRPVRFDALLDGGLQSCDRLWAVWDTTWWMNRDEVERARTAQALAAAPPGFALGAAYPHPALDVRLYQRVAAP